MSNESVTETMVAYRGIGVWTAQRMLCHSLGRFDILPTSDLYLLKTISNVFMDGRAVSPEDVEAFTDRWGEYKVPAMTYMVRGVGCGYRPDWVMAPAPNPPLSLSLSKGRARVRSPSFLRRQEPIPFFPPGCDIAPLT